MLRPREIYFYRITFIFQVCFTLIFYCFDDDMYGMLSPERKIIKGSDFQALSKSKGSP